MDARTFLGVCILAQVKRADCPFLSFFISHKNVPDVVANAKLPHNYGCFFLAESNVSLPLQFFLQGKLLKVERCIVRISMNRFTVGCV